MGLFRLPRYAIDWYRQRIALVRAGRVRGWALAEMVCMSMSLLTGAAVAAAWVARWAGGAPPTWLAHVVLPLLVAGAVGYLTNLIAITMLFRPYGPGDDHPAGMIPGWREGLVARHKAELAATAGRQVADKLLTPETIAAEVKVLIDRALDDKGLQEKLRYNLGPVIREKLPEVIDELTPEIMSFLRGMVSDGFTRENLDLLFEKVVNPWLHNGTNREQLADWVVDLLRDLTPPLVVWLQQTARAYRNKGFWYKAALWAAEKSKALDWDEVRTLIEERISDPATRKDILVRVTEQVAKVRAQVRDHEQVASGRHLQAQLSEFVVTVVDGHLKNTLPEFGHRIADRPSFWRSLATKGVPAIRPYLLAWLDGDGVTVIKDNFDVAGRVRASVEGMDVKNLHQMISEASARHLGAIQVLGYMLGLAAGACLLLV